MGVTIRQKRGKWYVFLHHHGTRRAKCIGTSRKAAEEAQRKLEAALALDAFALTPAAVPQSPPLAQYAAEWLAGYVALNCKESTARSYIGVLHNHVLPVLGATPLAQLTRDALKRLLLQKRTTHSRSTIRNILIPLRELLAHAVEDGLLPHNPATGLGRLVLPRKVSPYTMDPLTREELTVLLQAIATHAPTLAPLVLCLARTGMRLGEAFALQWGDIDVHGRFAVVRRNLVRGRLTTPKNHQGRRVDLSQQLTAVLQALQTQRKVETLQRGWTVVPPWVFCTPQGTPLEPTAVRRAWLRCLSKAGLRHLRLHDLRHTYASLLIQQGESLAYVRDQLGHSSIQITVDIYGHLMPGGNQGAVDRLDDAPKSASRATTRL